MPDPDEELITIAEFSDEHYSSDSDIHDSWDSIAFPRDYNTNENNDNTEEEKNDTPDHTSIQNVTDESEADRALIEELFPHDPNNPWDYDTVIEVESDTTLPTESYDSESQSSQDSTMPPLM